MPSIYTSVLSLEPYFNMSMFISPIMILFLFSLLIMSSTPKRVVVNISISANGNVLGLYITPVIVFFPQLDVTSTNPRQPFGRPVCLEVPDAPLHRQEGRQGYQPAAPIQHFNNKTFNWPAWFRHFRVIADVQVWDKNQRALQLVSYQDETAMNVVLELGDDELYDYDILVKLLGDRFDPASCVSASRCRFHGRSRRHHEDTDPFAEAITELCRVGYLQ